MSGRVTSRRRRKVRREKMKDEIRCCVEAFRDLIYRSNSKIDFPTRIYNRPTRLNESEKKLWHAQ